MTTDARAAEAPPHRPPLDNDAVEQLILAAGGRCESVREVVEDLGAERVCALLADEVAFRADIPVMDLFDSPLLLRFDITHGGLRAGHVVEAVHGKPVRLYPGSDDRAAMVVEYDLLDLVDDLFGPARDRRAGRRRLVPAFEKAARLRPDLTVPNVTRSAGQAVAAVLAGIDRPGDLGALATRYYSDKWGSLHWFTPHYEHHFADLRDKPVRVLEIGVGGYTTTTFGGGSLRMWRRFFTRGLIYGLDLFDKTVADQPRVKTLIGSQADPGLLAAIAARHGPFDVIIDDGSHVNAHVLTSFRTLLPHLRPGGRYVIEDLWTAYSPSYGGVTGRTAGPGTSVGLLKELLDGLHHENHGEPDGTGAQVVGVHVYHNLAVVEKGRNEEGGVPAWCSEPHPGQRTTDADAGEDDRAAG
ncbi:class I SAM-dependent methyltransferase [Streptomyces sp. SID486]|uniref:class I SAM-dependent methyltransferase n=1 Tax=unclassified Streptomyces TaxID=2593676 RepID=UPI00136DE734|nr:MULTISPECIES: class I SAM-dependent methyltransferase [unclassified Streptomyces]MYW18178.1 class I SAM-dependent methyltransferase [Streptomyces sp. SID2955]MYW47373.1 class I SAM-dependent methyltransferase [Streptomyces sp. SID161]MYX96623.1 class I SAM-dependent methyltransferase [Streptomyces sp. SID486]